MAEKASKARVNRPSVLMVEITREVPGAARHYGPKLFAEELWEAVKLVLPVYLFLVMCCSLLCLILVSLMNHLISESLGEEIIVYGQFYLPLSVVYWIMKKDWLAAERTPLPTSRPGKRLQSKE
eukprot:g7948.t1